MSSTKPVILKLSAILYIILLHGTVDLGFF